MGCIAKAIVGLVFRGKSLFLCQCVECASIKVHHCRRVSADSAAGSRKDDCREAAEVVIQLLLRVMPRLSWRRPTDENTCILHILLLLCYTKEAIETTTNSVDAVHVFLHISIAVWPLQGNN